MNNIFKIALLLFVVAPSSAFASIPWVTGSWWSLTKWNVWQSNVWAAKDNLSLLTNIDFWWNIGLWIISLVLTVIIAKAAKIKLINMIEDKMWADQSWDISWVILRTVTLFIYFFWISLSLTLWWLDLTFLIWGIWIGLGFTMQTFLSNFIAWIIMIFWGEYKSGTLVEIQWKMWYIQRISSLFTSVRQFDWVIVFVPNVKFLQEEVQCFNINNSRRLELDVWIDYDADLTKTKKVINKVIAAFPNILKAPEPYIMVDRLSDDGVELKVMVWMSVDDDILKLQSNLTEAINMAFTQADIKRKQSHIIVQNYDESKE